MRLQCLCNISHTPGCKYLAFAVIRAINLYIHELRVHWGSGTGIDNGAGLPNVSFYFL